jgi:hypothetical protein
MTEPLKHIYNPAFFENLCPVLKQNIPGFECSYFIHRLFNNQWPDLEFKERVTHIAKVLNDFLPQEFENAFEILLRVANGFRKNAGREHRLALIFINEWIMIFGNQQGELSTAALKEVAALRDDECINRPFVSNRITLAFEFQLESSDN